MSFFDRRLLRVAAQIVGLILVVGVVAVTVRGLGTLMLPERDTLQEPVVSEPVEVSTTLLPSLSALKGTTAVIAVAGIVDPFVLDRVIASELADYGRFSITFRNGSLDSLVISGTGSPGVIEGEALDVSGSFAGRSLFGTRGQCTASIESMEMRETKPFDMTYYSVGPIGSGQISCAGMTAIGSEQLVSLEAVFRFDQRLCYGGPTVCP